VTGRRAHAGVGGLRCRRRRTRQGVQVRCGSCLMATRIPCQPGPERRGGSCLSCRGAGRQRSGSDRTHGGSIRTHPVRLLAERRQEVRTNEGIRFGRRRKPPRTRMASRFPRCHPPENEIQAGGSVQMRPAANSSRVAARKSGWQRFPGGCRRAKAPGCKIQAGGSEQKRPEINFEQVFRQAVATAVPAVRIVDQESAATAGATEKTGTRSAGRRRPWKIPVASDVTNRKVQPTGRRPWRDPQSTVSATCCRQ
jgi:hypothetical protein